MRLTDEEQAMLAGEFGEPRRWAMTHQIAVGEFFDAEDFVPVSQAHIMADTESLGEAGVRFLEGLAAAPEAERRVRVPTITDPRGIDFAAYRRLGQTPEMATLEQRAIEVLRAFGVLMTDTCINYQTIMAPIRGEHLAFGDTGVVIYSNSVLGARSNFEGGPSALAAALTGRTPRYGYHLDACRGGTRRFRLTATPGDLSEWGALGGIIGEACGSYWGVPVIEGVAAAPDSDALKHFGTALASFGSVALFHMPGITPEEPAFV
jgi:predicted aconitase